MVLPSVFKIATTKFGAALLLRLVGINISKLLNRSQLRYNIVLQHSGRGWFSDFCLLSMPLPSTLRVISKTLHFTDIVSHFVNSYILLLKSLCILTSICHLPHPAKILRVITRLLRFSSPDLQDLLTKEVLQTSFTSK